MLPPRVHVTELRPGDQLRVAMKAGYHIEQDHTGYATSPRKGTKASGFARTVFFAFVVANDPQAGQMVVNVQETQAHRPPYSATLLYKNIRFLEYVVQPGWPLVETAPAQHPGAKALGTKMTQLFPQPRLVAVSFVGK